VRNERGFAYLEITVNDSLAVHVVDGLEDLLDQICSIPLGVAALFHDPVEQFAAIDPRGRGQVWVEGSVLACHCCCCCCYCSTPPSRPFATLDLERKHDPSLMFYTNQRDSRNGLQRSQPGGHIDTFEKLQRLSCGQRKSGAQIWLNYSCHRSNLVSFRHKMLARMGPSAGEKWRA